ncbi:MAG: hypothetical protein AB7F74_11605 [Parvibaculaceae bacterium]
MQSRQYSLDMGQAALLSRLESTQRSFLFARIIAPCGMDEDELLLVLDMNLTLFGISFCRCETGEQ